MLRVLECLSSIPGLVPVYGMIVRMQRCRHVRAAVAERKNWVSSFQVQFRNSSKVTGTGALRAPAERIRSSGYGVELINPFATDMHMRCTFALLQRRVQLAPDQAYRPTGRQETEDPFYIILFIYECLSKPAIPLLRRSART
jgi:hypothetical protein